MARLKIGNVFPPLAWLLQRCAPAGYGLGGYAKTLDSTADINTIKSFGAYSWATPAPANAPSDYMCMVPVFRNSTNGTQYFQRDTPDGAYEVCGKRVMADGVWGEFEWVNPPMVPGAEYRTTERWMGKAVYAKLINFSPLPNNTESSVWLDITGATAVVDYSITTRNADGDVFYNAGMMSVVTGSWAKLNEFGNIGVYITTNTDASHLSAYCIVRYVKD